MKKLILIIAGVVVLGGILYLNLASDHTNATKVKSAVVGQEDLIEVVSASGRIQPSTKVDITSEVNGEIIRMAVEEGQQVNQGDLLIVLDTVQLQTDADQARFAVNELKARLDGAKSRLDEAKEEYDRQDSLYKLSFSSETEFKTAKYAYNSAKSSYDATKAQTDQAQSRYEKQLDNLSKAKIIAPMTGIVTFLDAEVGEIAAAQTAFTQGKTLLTISDLSLFEVEVEVDETEINKIILDQESSIEVDAFPDTTFKGRVVEIGNTAITTGAGTQDQSTNFNVKVVFEDSDVKIKPGMSATVDITTAKAEGVMALPFSAVVMRTMNLDSLEAARNAEEEGETLTAGSVQAAETDTNENQTNKKDIKREELKGVFVIREGKARFVEIKTGIADQQNIQVMSGVEVGDTVISGPYRALRNVNDGDDLEILPDKQDKKD